MADELTERPRGADSPQGDSSGLDYYTLFGVGRAALPETIRTAAELRRRELERRGAGSEELAAIDRALLVLMDPNQRTRYDEALARGAPPPSPSAPGRAAFVRSPVEAPPAAAAEVRPVYIATPAAPELSRILAFFKIILVIPAYTALWLFGLVHLLVTVLALPSILLFERFPPGLHELSRGYVAALTRTYAYFPLLLTDSYPLGGAGELDLEIDEPARLTRSFAVIRLVTFVPILGNLSQSFLISILAIVSVPLWLVLVVTGRYPIALWRRMVGVLEWMMAVYAWQWFLTDDFRSVGASRQARAALAAITVGPAVVVALFATGTIGPDNSWRSVNASDAGFVADFPGEPTITTSTERFELLGISRFTRYERKTLDFLVWVDVLRPADSRLSLSPSLGQQFYFSSFQALGMDIYDIGPTRHGGLDGSEFFFESADVDSSGWMRFFVVDRTIFAVGTEWRGLKSAPRDAQRFMLSFDLLTDETAR